MVPVLILNIVIFDGLSPSEEWIERISLEGVENNSGQPTNGSGYSDFTAFTLPEVELGQTYTLELEPGYNGSSFAEVFSVFIDFNQNGNFDLVERVFESEAVNGPTSGEITIPPTADIGNTRLRIVMLFSEPAGPCPNPDNEFGEVEDYCLVIKENDACSVPATIDSLSAGPNNINVGWPATAPAVNYILRYRASADDLWSAVQVAGAENTYNLAILDTCATYEFQIRTICALNQSFFSESFYYSTSCNVTSTKNQVLEVDLSIWPNPTTDFIQLEIETSQAIPDLTIQLFDSFGRNLLQQEMDLRNGMNYHKLHFDDLPSGVYWLQLENALGEKAIKKLIKI